MRQNKSGGFVPHLDESITKRINRYCEIKHLNRTIFVAECVSKYLDVCEKSIYEQMTKEELIELLLNK